MKPTFFDLNDPDGWVRYSAYTALEADLSDAKLLLGLAMNFIHGEPAAKHMNQRIADFLILKREFRLGTASQTTEEGDA